jgi:apolipoprotein N-acyltransferase
MAEILCALLSAVLFDVSTGVSEIWPLAWIAFSPLLWLAYSDRPLWRVIGAILIAALMLAFLALLSPIRELLPARTLAIVLAVYVATTAASWSAAILIARLAFRRLHPLFTLLAFPATLTGLDYVLSVTSPDGAGWSISHTQVAAPILVQSASLFGIWSITFLLALIANAIALALRDKKHAVLICGVAAGILTTNLIFGASRLQEQAEETVRVGIAARDLPLISGRRGRESEVAMSEAYSTAARDLSSRGASIIVFPELMGVLSPEWRGDVLAPLARTAQETGSQITAGFFDRSNAEIRNVAVTVTAAGETSIYAKRRPLPGLDPSLPGTEPGLLGNGLAVAICKDMDFPNMIRGDARNGIRLMLVPAADFNYDGWTHGRIAIMRSIENGFSMARAARNGILTINDAYGRIIARTDSGQDEIVSLIADVPLGRANTLYTRIGDVFAWACLAVIFLLLVLLLRGRREA